MDRREFIKKSGMAAVGSLLLATPFASILAKEEKKKEDMRIVVFARTATPIIWQISSSKVQKKPVMKFSVSMRQQVRYIHVLDATIVEWTGHAYMTMTLQTSCAPRLSKPTWLYSAHRCITLVHQTNDVTFLSCKA